MPKPPIACSSPPTGRRPVARAVRAALGRPGWVMAALVAATSPATYALGLSEATVRSRLGQPLEVDITLTLDEAEARNAGAVTVEVPGYWRQRELGLEAPLLPPALALSLDLAGGESDAVRLPLRRKVRLRTREPVHEPVLDFLVRAQSSQATVMREYALIIDPPVMPPGTATGQPVAGPVRVPAPPADLRPGERPYGPVVRGETLAGIVRTGYPELIGRAAEVARLVFERNRREFLGGDPTRLMEGSTLVLPPAASVRAGLRAERPAPAAAPRVTAARASPGTSHTVRPGETLYGIAGDVYRVRGADLARVARAILEANPDVFPGGDVNRLPRGATLRLPGLESFANGAGSEGGAGETSAPAVAGDLAARVAALRAQLEEGRATHARLAARLEEFTARAEQLQDRYAAQVREETTLRTRLAALASPATAVVAAAPIAAGAAERSVRAEPGRDRGGSSTPPPESASAVPEARPRVAATVEDPPAPRARATGASPAAPVPAMAAATLATEPPSRFATPSPGDVVQPLPVGPARVERLIRVIDADTIQVALGGLGLTLMLGAGALRWSRRQGPAAPPVLESEDARYPHTRRSLERLAELRRRYQNGEVDIEFDSGILVDDLDREEEQAAELEIERQLEAESEVERELAIEIELDVEDADEREAEAAHENGLAFPVPSAVVVEMDRVRAERIAQAAAAYVAAEDYAKAEERIREAIGLEPDRRSHREALLTLLRTTGRFREAESLARELEVVQAGLGGDD